MTEVYETVSTASATRMILPTFYELGNTRDYALPRANGETFTLEKGTYLGLGSSHRDRHNTDAQKGGHPGSDVAREGQRCSACRWIEIRLFRVLYGEGTQRRPFYVVHITGQTIVEGEHPEYTLHDPTPSPDQVGESLTVVNRSDQPMISRPARLALSCAAQYDVSIADYWDNYLADRSGIFPAEREEKQ